MSCSTVRRALDGFVCDLDWDLILERFFKREPQYLYEDLHQNWSYQQIKPWECWVWHMAHFPNVTTETCGRSLKCCVNSQGSQNSSSRTIQCENTQLHKSTGVQVYWMFSVQVSCASYPRVCFPGLLVYQPVVIAQIFTLGLRQEYTQDGAKIHCMVPCSDQFTPKGSVAQPVHLLVCFWDTVPSAQGRTLELWICVLVCMKVFWTMLLPVNLQCENM